MSHMLHYEKVGEKMHKDYLKNFHALFYQELFSLIKNNSSLYSIKHYKKEQIIALSGDDCPHVGIVLDGVISIEQIHSDGSKNIINTLKQYDIFGEILIFSDQSTYPYDIIASKNCEILFITKQNLLKIFKEDIDFLDKFLYHISISYMNLNQLIKLKSQKTIIHKLAYFLLNYAHISKNNLNCKIESKTKLAQLMGVERQSLIRELNHLRDSDILTYDRHFIYVKDLDYFKGLI